eukprot:187581_1
MEDWYHSKTKHFKTETDYTWFKNNEYINCDNNQPKNCIHITRHNRHRSREMYNVHKEIDHKNLILRDQIDSIHTFVCHSVTKRSTAMPNVDVSLFDDDIKGDAQYNNINTDTKCAERELSRNDLWSDEPASIRDCNLSQISYILNKEHIFDDLDRLIEYKEEIINYVKVNELNGSKLNGMKRKTFINKLCHHFDNNKIRGQLGQLYTLIIKFDIKGLYANNKKEENIKEDDMKEKVWENNPLSIAECSINQIIQILQNEDILNKLHILKEYKDDIIKYLKQNELDGAKLSELNRKMFINQICQHFNNNNKLKGAMGRMYSMIMKCDVVKFWKSNSDA